MINKVSLMVLHHHHHHLRFLFPIFFYTRDILAFAASAYDKWSGGRVIHSIYPQTAPTTLSLWRVCMNTFYEKLNYFKMKIMSWSWQNVVAEGKTLHGSWFHGHGVDEKCEERVATLKKGRNCVNSKKYSSARLNPVKTTTFSKLSPLSCPAWV